MKGQIASGVFKGAGAAINVSVGFVPSLVILNNSRGAAETLTLWNGYPVLGFDSGSAEILRNDLLVDASAGGSFTVVSVTLLTGSWAGGDAAGFMEIKAETGTITNNNTLNRRATEGRAGATDVATIDGAVTYFDIDIDTETGTPASRFVTAYEGVSGSAAKGFTVAAGAAVSGEYIRWIAFGSDE